MKSTVNVKLIGLFWIVNTKCKLDWILNTKCKLDWIILDSDYSVSAVVRTLDLCQDKQYRPRYEETV